MLQRSHGTACDLEGVNEEDLVGWNSSNRLRQHSGCNRGIVEPPERVCDDIRFSPPTIGSKEDGKTKRSKLRHGPTCRIEPAQFLRRILS